MGGLFRQNTQVKKYTTGDFPLQCDFDADVSFLLAAFRSQNNSHPSSFHLWCLIGLGDLTQRLRESRQQFASSILVNNVSASELHPGFDLVALLKEFLSMPGLEVEIVLVSVRAEANFLQGNVVLLLASLFFLLLQLISVFTEISNLADGWIDIGGDLYEIQVIALCKRQRFVDRIYAMASIGIYDSHRQCADMVVDSRSGFALPRKRLLSFCDVSIRFC